MKRVLLVCLISTVTCATSPKLLDTHKGKSANSSYVNGEWSAHTRVTTSDKSGLYCKSKPSDDELNRSYDRINKGKTVLDCFTYECAKVTTKKGKDRSRTVKFKSAKTSHRFKDFFKSGDKTIYSDCSFQGDMAFKRKFNITNAKFPFSKEELATAKENEISKWKKKESECRNKRLVSCDQVYIHFAKSDKKRALRARNQICTLVNLPLKHCDVLKRLRPR